MHFFDELPKQKFLSGFVDKPGHEGWIWAKKTQDVRHHVLKMFDGIPWEAVQAKDLIGDYRDEELMCVCVCVCVFFCDKYLCL